MIESSNPTISTRGEELHRKSIIDQHSPKKSDKAKELVDIRFCRSLSPFAFGSL